MSIGNIAMDSTIWSSDPASFGQLVLAWARGSHTLDAFMTDVDRRQRIAYAIRAAREERQLSREQLGELLGVSRSTVNDWENATTLPGLMTLGPLCDALGVDPDLFAHPPEIPVSPVHRYLRDPDPPKDSEAAV
jgi:DNA-binding XRE family transcriptional regulator